MFKMAQILVFIFCTASTFAHVIIVNAPFNTKETEPLYITGSTAELCFWKPKCLRLEFISKGLYRIELNSSPENSKFKITRGSWSSEASDQYGNPLKNFILDLAKKPNVLNLKNWKDFGRLKKVGSFKVFAKFKSNILNNVRRVTVRLPESYNQLELKSYPVIYMHDGQNLFDPYRSTFGTDWSVDDELLRLEKEYKVKEAIIVGIDHLERREEFNYFDRGKDYANFIVKELKPFIDEHFRTLSDRENTFIMGSSYGAMISFSTAWIHSDVFAKAGCLSLPAHSLDEMLFKFVSAFKIPSNPPLFYIDHGAVGFDSKYPPFVKRFYRHLMNKGLNPEFVKYFEFPYADHTEADWARRVHIPLLNFLQF